MRDTQEERRHPKMSPLQMPYLTSPRHVSPSLALQFNLITKKHSNTVVLRLFCLLSRKKRVRRVLGFRIEGTLQPDQKRPCRTPSTELAAWCRAHQKRRSPERNGDSLRCFSKLSSKTISAGRELSDANELEGSKGA